MEKCPFKKGYNMKKIDKHLLEANIQKQIQSDLDEQNICGVSVLVAQSGKETYRAHFGIVSSDSNIPITENTTFRMASMTKPITTVAALILVDKGLLSLDDTIDEYIPEFSEMSVLTSDSEIVPTNEKITVRNILTHTSGIGSGEAWTRTLPLMKFDDIQRTDNFVKFLSEQPLSFVPGTKEEYSGIAAFSLLVVIVEKICGCTFEEFLKKELFDPCRMKDTTFCPTEEQWKRLVVMHDKKDGKAIVGEMYDGCVFEMYPPTNTLAGAGLISSLEDYYHFASMLLSNGSFEGKRIVSESLIKEMSRIQLPPELHHTKESWGLGVRVIKNDDHKALPKGAYGWSGAYGTHFWIDPLNEIVAIYMRNSKYDGGSGSRIAAKFEVDVAASLI